jgi:hypothetical protein
MSYASGPGGHAGRGSRHDQATRQPLVSALLGFHGLGDDGGGLVGG